MNFGEYDQKKDNFELALDTFYGALSFARQRDFGTGPALCSLGDLLMESELFDGAGDKYTEAENAKESRLPDAGKLPKELRKSRLRAMIKFGKGSSKEWQAGPFDQ